MNGQGEGKPCARAPGRIAGRDGPAPTRGEWLAVGALLVAFVIPVLGWGGDASEFLEPAGSEQGREEEGGLAAKGKWVALAAFAIFCTVKHGTHMRRLSPGSLGLVLFTLSASVSTLANAYDPMDALMRSLSFALLCVIACVWGVPLHPGTRIRCWTTALLTVSMGIVLASLLLLANSESFANGRFRGITCNANTLATFAAAGFVGILAYVFQAKGKWKLALLSLAGVSLLSLVLTQSRTALAAAACAVMILLLRTGRWLTLLALVATVALIVLGSAMLDLMEAGSTNFSARDYSSDTRTLLWQLQIDSWMSAPLSGHGLELRDESGTGRVHAEGSYFDLLSSVGLLGFLPFFWSIALGCYSLFRASRLPHTPKSHSSLVTLTLVTLILINSVGEAYLAGVGNALVIYTWVICGTLTNYSPRIVRPPRPYRPLSHLLHPIPG